MEARAHRETPEMDDASFIRLFEKVEELRKQPLRERFKTRKTPIRKVKTQTRAYTSMLPALLSDMFVKCAA